MPSSMQQKVNDCLSYLDSIAVGNTEAKKILATSALSLPDDNARHVVLVGPVGASRVILVRALAKHLGFTMHRVDALNLQEFLPGLLTEREENAGGARKTLVMIDYCLSSSPAQNICIQEELILLLKGKTWRLPAREIAINPAGILFVLNVYPGSDFSTLDNLS